MPPKNIISQSSFSDDLFLNLLFPESILFTSKDQSLFSSLAEETSFPKLNIYFENNEYVVEAGVSGIKKEDIKIEMKDNILSISYNKEKNEETNNRQYYLKELKESSFCRKIRIPNTVNIPEKAEYSNGILILKFKLKEENIPKQISIN